MSTDAVIHPKFHHVNLKTTRLQEMIDWYSTLVGAEVVPNDVAHGLTIDAQELVAGEKAGDGSR